jgi:hypothetical protein
MEKNNEMSKKVLGLNLDQKLTELMDLKESNDYSTNNQIVHQLSEIRDLAGAYGVKNVVNYMVYVIDVFGIDDLSSRMKQVGKVYTKIDEIDDNIKYFDKNMDLMDEKTSKKILQNIGNNIGKLLDPDNGVEKNLISRMNNRITDDLQKNISNLSKKTFKYKGKDIGLFYK